MVSGLLTSWIRKKKGIIWVGLSEILCTQDIKQFSSWCLSTPFRGQYETEEAHGEEQYIRVPAGGADIKPEEARRDRRWL